ncbi:MAG: AzlD domain-containing protein [Acidimicrobiales bacterium]
MTLWLTIIAAGVVTYLTRASFIAAGDRVKLPVSVERSLNHVGPAAFAAIAAPALLGGDQFAEFGDDIPRLIAVSVAGLVIWRTRNVPASLVCGMGTLWMILWLS